RILDLDVGNVPRTHEGHGHVAVDEGSVRLVLVILSRCPGGETLPDQIDVVLHGGHTLRPVEDGPPGVDVHQFAAEGPEDDGPVVDEVVGVGAGDGDGPARAVGGDQLLADGDQLLIGLGGFHAGGREHVLV